MIYHMFPELDLYSADLAQSLTSAREAELDYLDNYLPGECKVSRNKSDRL